MAAAGCDPPVLCLAGMPPSPLARLPVCMTVVRSHPSCILRPPCAAHDSHSVMSALASSSCSAAAINSQAAAGHAYGQEPGGGCCLPPAVVVDLLAQLLQLLPQLAAPELKALALHMLLQLVQTGARMYTQPLQGPAESCACLHADVRCSPHGGHGLPLARVC